MQANARIKAGLSAPEALAFAMVTAAAADRAITQVELMRMQSMVRELPAFRGLDEAWFSRVAQECGRVLSKPEGVDNVVRLIAEALTGGLRETAYALAAEVAASDLSIKDDERSFLALLAVGLQLDDLVRAALQWSAQVRHRAV